MEIFQTIWTALTTENIQLIKIFTVFFSLLEGYISLLLITAIFNISATKKQKILYVLFMALSGFITKFIIPNPYNTYVNIIMFFLINVLIFKLSIFKGIISLVIPFIITIFLESIFSNIYSKLFNIDYYVGMNIPLHRLIGTCIIYFVEYLISILIKYSKLNLRKFEIVDKKKKVLLTLTVILGIVLIAFQLYILAFYSSTLPFWITLLNLFGLLIYLSLSLYIIFTISKLEMTSTNLKEAQLYNKTLEILQDNTRAFRHDFTNILVGMTGYIDRNDMEGLKKYHSQLLDDIKQVNNLTTLSPKVVNNPGVYNVLANKYHKADSLGIKINLEVFLDLNDLHMKIYEFTRVLGILMDNAIEACSECEKKIINVSIRKDSRKHMELLVIENTYKDKGIDTEKIYEKGYSTKQGNTGLGLWEVRQILKKNNNLNLYTTKTDEFFSQQFEIYY